MLSINSISASLIERTRLRCCPWLPKLASIPLIKKIMSSLWGPTPVFFLKISLDLLFFKLDLKLSTKFSLSIKFTEDWYLIDNSSSWSDISKCFFRPNDSSFLIKSNRWRITRQPYSTNWSSRTDRKVSSIFCVDFK